MESDRIQRGAARQHKTNSDRAGMNALKHFII